MSTGRLHIAAALVLLGPFVPMLFAGEEWGASTPFLYFTDHRDAELGRAVSEGRRREFAAFGWDPESIPDPQDAETFERSRLRWQERQAEPHASLLRWHRELIGLRRSLPALRDGYRGALAVEAEEGSRTLVMRRAGLIVACNWGDGPHRIACHGATVLLASPGVVEDDHELTLPPDSVAVLRD